MRTAYSAWLRQKKTYKLAVVPEPTIFIDSNRGLDTNPGTRVAPYQTISKLYTAAPAAGACVGLANDSTFDLSEQITFSSFSSVALNGTSESARITFTNYDPGAAPTTRPRIRFNFKPTDLEYPWIESCDPRTGPWSLHGADTLLRGTRVNFGPC